MTWCHRGSGLSSPVASLAAWGQAVSGLCCVQTPEACMSLQTTDWGAGKGLALPLMSCLENVERAWGLRPHKGRHPRPGEEGV